MSIKERLNVLDFIINILGIHEKDLRFIYKRELGPLKKTSQKLIKC